MPTGTYPHEMTTLVSYEGKVAAVCGPSRVFLAPWLEGRPEGDPELRVVAIMCLFVRELREGRIAGRYSDERAARFAEAALGTR